MNVLVIGAAGETGKLVVERAVAAGHAVTVLVHDAGDYHAPAGVVRVVGGAVAGQEAVVDALGGKAQASTGRGYQMRMRSISSKVISSLVRS